MKLNSSILLCLAASAMALPTQALAQPENLMTMSPAREGNTSGPPLLQYSLSGGHTASGRTRYLGRDQSNSGAGNLEASVFAPVPVSEAWVFPLGLSTENIWLDEVPGVPIDDQIHTLGFHLGVGHRLSDDWMLMGMLNPTLYKFSDVGSNDLGLSGGIHAMWSRYDALSVMFGFMVAPDSDIAVLPVAGVDWRITESWELRLMFPKPQLVFQPGERWRFFAGADLVGATFRSGDTLGLSLGDPRYNDALATYRDIRLGGGLGYHLTKSVSIDLEGGFSVNREINFKGLEKVEFESAPYLRIGLSMGF